MNICQISNAEPTALIQIVYLKMLVWNQAKPTSQLF